MYNVRPCERQVFHPFEASSIHDNPKRTSFKNPNFYQRDHERWSVAVKNMSFWLNLQSEVNKKYQIFARSRNSTQTKSTTKQTEKAIKRRTIPTRCFGDQLIWKQGNDWIIRFMLDDYKHVMLTCNKAKAWLISQRYWLHVSPVIITPVINSNFQHKCSPSLVIGLCNSKCIHLNGLKTMFVKLLLN